MENIGATWIDIPAHRILAVPEDIFNSDYRKVREDGGEAGEWFYRAIRISDNKVFARAKFVPCGPTKSPCFYLEEI